MTTISKQIEELSRDQLVATDEGTHGGANTIRVMERLDGSRYTVRCHGGAVTATTPGVNEETDGRLLWPAASTAAQRRQSIAELRKQEIADGKSAERLASRRNDLARGWDGFQFVGVAEGQRRLAAMS